MNARVEKVWKYWNEPAHITQWCSASDDWYAPYSENDLRKDGKFKTTMAAKDGSYSFIPLIPATGDFLSLSKT